MSKLLIDDYLIRVLPKLALKIGLNEAIFLQQVHYWLNKSNHRHIGKKWLYNTYNDWQEQFPFWSVMTIRRTIASLEKKNLLITDNFNRAGFDKTKWYTINYEALNIVNNGCVQNEQPYTRDYSEITAETTKDILSNKFDKVNHIE